MSARDEQVTQAIRSEISNWAFTGDDFFALLGEPERGRFEELGWPTAKGRQESMLLYGSDLSHEPVPPPGAQVSKQATA